MKTNGKTCCRSKPNAHHRRKKKKKERFAALFCAGFVPGKIINVYSANRRFSDLKKIFSLWGFFPLYFKVHEDFTGYFQPDVGQALENTDNFTCHIRLLSPHYPFSGYVIAVSS